MTKNEAIRRLKVLTDYEYDEDLEALDMAIKALEQQPCEDAISRQALIEKATSWDKHFADSERCVGLTDIQNAQSVTPQPKIGRWIDIQYFEADDTYYRPKCPFCNTEPKEYSNYCPNCGADMTELKSN